MIPRWSFWTNRPLGSTRTRSRRSVSSSVNWPSDKTVLLSTHILQEVEAVADRLVIINAGRIVGDGTLPELQQKTQRYARALFAVVAPRAEVEVALKELRGVRRLRCTGVMESLTHFELQAAPGMHVLPELGALAQARGWQVGELQERPPTLEEVFLALTEPQEAGQRQERRC